MRHKVEELRHKRDTLSTKFSALHRHAFQSYGTHWTRARRELLVARRELRVAWKTLRRASRTSRVVNTTRFPKRTRL